jgi:hypothetical protein
VDAGRAGMGSNSECVEGSERVSGGVGDRTSATGVSIA